MNIVIFFIFVVCICGVEAQNSKNVNSQYFHQAFMKLAEEPIPQQFGVLVVTYARGGKIDAFSKFLRHITEIDCPAIMELNIIWNNQKPPEQYNLYQNKTRWKVKVNVRKTPFNSMNWRYQLPVENDDMKFTCKQMTDAFSKWQSQAVGSLGPLLSCAVRSIRVVKNALQYEPRGKKYIAFALAGCAFISRHYLQLYYADTWQIQRMREEVIQKNNCDDLALNWIVITYYPEFRPGHINLINTADKNKIGQQYTKTHYVFRSKCVDLFARIFKSAIPYQPVDYSEDPKEDFLLKRQIVFAKRAYIEEKLLKKPLKYGEKGMRLQKQYPPTMILNYQH